MEDIEGRMSFGTVVGVGEGLGEEEEEKGRGKGRASQGDEDKRGKKVRSVCA